MNTTRNNNRIRVTAGIMVCMMLVVVLFSAFFLAAHADHDCCGEDCPVCACMHQCENNIRGMGNGVKITAAAIMPIIAAIVLISACVSVALKDTLVSRKVRLDN